MRLDFCSFLFINTFTYVTVYLFRKYISLHLTDFYTQKTSMTSSKKSCNK